MKSDRLRLDFNMDSPASECRIDGGKVQVRSRASDGEQSAWRSLTPHQLSSHVERNTVVAQWLERHLGWRRLLRACVGEEAMGEEALSEAEKCESGSSDAASAVR